METAANSKPTLKIPKDEKQDAKKYQLVAVTDELIKLNYAPAARLFRIGEILNQMDISTKVIPFSGDLPLALRNNNRTTKYLRRIFLFASLFSLIRHNNVNNILARGIYMGLASIILAKIFLKNSIYDFHGLRWKEMLYKDQKIKSALFYVIEIICLKHSCWVIAQTDSNRKIAQGYNKQALFLGNGIFVDEYTSVDGSKIFEKYNIRTTKPLVGFIGNWESWMRIEDLLGASEYLQSANVIVIGEGKGIKYFKERYDKVIFTGKIPHKDAIRFLSNFSVCVSPYSKDEIMLYKSAVKTIEYMAAGKPIIVSDVVGKEEFLKHGENCIFYEPENPKDLAEKIELLLADSHVRSLMGKNNYELAKDFTWEKILKRSGLIEILNKNSEPSIKSS